MNFELKSLGLDVAAADKSDAAIVLVPNGFKAARDPLSACIAAAQKAEDFGTQPGKQLALYRVPAVAAARIHLAGIGEGRPQEVRQAVAAGVSAFKGTGAKRLLVAFAGAAAQPDAVAAAVQAVADASYVYTTTKPKAEARAWTRVVVGVPDAAVARTAFAQAVATVLGVELAKEWGNRPANHATPTMLGDAAQALAKLPGIQCQVLGPKEVARLGMGAFAAVARGSQEPLRFIELRYSGAAKSDAPVVLVGKGITFDSGGISIKPAAEMDEMKYDMCGAASVLGTFRALAELRPAINVVGLIAACENMPGGRAVKPGDVVTSMSGQTIEILNTDAEGRLVLCDALAYAQRFKPRAVIDIATLTGACVIALGGVRSGLFSADDALAATLQAAGEAAQDKCWRMPLDDEYADGLKTHFADVANVAGRPAGAVTAAKFLERFSGGAPWAHLDIAGTAWRGGAAKGATGRPVGLLLHYVLAQAAKPLPLQPKSVRRKAASA
ncbi:leucyl aminopeptidase [Ramlibacter sp. H39-3-26]|uniref:leucyl aminopeptidase n=1 Tax=Curvibacter soli TaxID=3031331 RepID=UPI0023D9B7C2|nr:leucyl aminopeptidase [Ramlibacter sp. H39-3-26]MDF1485666.1 leucyl aminopeptidase [Ramlibacter sp. H39-3-26]